MKNVVRTLAIPLFLLGSLLVGGCGGDEKGPISDLLPHGPTSTFSPSPGSAATPGLTIAAPSAPSPTPSPAPTLSPTLPVPVEVPRPGDAEETPAAAFETPVAAEEPEVTVEPTQAVEPTQEPTQTVESTPSTTPSASSTPIPEPSGDFLVLRGSLEQELANSPYHDVGVCVTDLQNGQTICINGDVQHYTACVIDLFALFAAVEQFQAGKASPDDYIESAGTTVAVQIRAGIGSSSPENAAIFLAATHGGSLEEGTYHARDIVAKLGLTGTTFGSVPTSSPIEPNPPANVSTAWDTNQALTKLWNGEIFNPERTAYAVKVLTESEYTDYMPALVQWKGATVAHKVGYFGAESGYPLEVRNDVGIIFWEKDDRRIAFALSFFSEGPWGGKEIVAKLADISFDYFNAKY